MGDPSKNGGYLFHQIVCSLLVGLNAFIASLCMGYSSPALPSMMADKSFSLTEEEGSWITSLLSISSAIGFLGGGRVIDTYGRQKVFIITSISFLASWLIVYFAITPLHVMMARLLAGLTLGLQGVAAAVYMPEVVQADIRPMMGIIPGMMATGGFLFVYVIGEILNWRDLALFGSVISVIEILLSLYTPETPSFLVSKDKKREAEKILLWLRETRKCAEDELTELVEEKKNNPEKGLNLLELRRPPYKWPVGTAIALMLFQQLSGMMVIFSYASIIFEHAGAPEYGGICSIALAAVNTIFTLINGKLLMSWERRKLLKISSMVIIFSHVILSMFFYFQSNITLLQSTYCSAFIPLSGLVIYSIGLSLGWGPVPYVFLGEGLTTVSRGITSSLCLTVGSLVTFIVLKSFHTMMQLVGMGGIFLVYAAFTGIGQLLMNRYLPETKDKTILQIDKLYQDHAMQWYKNK